MGFGPYSQVVKPAEWVDPMDLNVYAKGTMYKQELAEKNLQSIVAAHDSLFSIPAYGPDKKKLAELDQQFRQQVAGMNISNLGSLESMSQIKGLIGQYSTNADILSIAERGYNYKSMLKEKEEADKKNKIYMNRGMKKLNSYFSGEDYVQNLKYGNDGYIAPDAVEIYTAVDKLVTPDEKMVDLGGGNYQIVKTYDPTKLTKAFETVVASNPNWEKYYRDLNEDAFDGVNADELAKQSYSGLITENQSIIAQATQLKNATKDPKTRAYYDSKIAEAQQEIADTNKKLSNPYMGIVFKQESLSQSKKNAIKQMSEAMQFKAEGEVKMTKSAEINAQLSKEMTMEGYKFLLPGASQYNLSRSEVLQLASKGQITKDGKVVTLADVGNAAIDYEAKEAYQKSLKSAEAKAKVKQETLGKLGNPKISPSEQITIGGVTQSKQLWDMLIKKGSEKKADFTAGDKSSVAAIIKEFPDMFGLTAEQTYALTGENIQFNSKGQIKIDTGFFSRELDAADFSKISTAVSTAGTMGTVDQSNPLISGPVDQTNPLLK